MRKITRTLVTGLLLAGLTLNFNACTEQAPFAPAKNDVDASIITLAKKGKKDKDKSTDENKDENQDQNDGYAFSGSTTLKFKKGAYKGGNIQLGQGSMLTIPKKSLTPPQGTPAGADVTITMNVELVDGELNLTFGPHGCQFDPPAELRVDYSDLGVDRPTLFYIDENGNSIEQTPDHIDTKGKWLTLSFDHFSRYAVAWSN